MPAVVTNTVAPSDDIEKLVTEFRKLLMQAKAQAMNGDAFAKISHNTGDIVGRRMGLEWTLKP